METLVLLQTNELNIVVVSSNVTDNIWRCISALIRQDKISETVQDRGPGLEIQPSKNSSGGILWMEKDCDIECGAGLFFSGKKHKLG